MDYGNYHYSNTTIVSINLDEAIQIAKNNNDDEYVRELQQERQNILDEYAKKLEELTNA